MANPTVLSSEPLTLADVKLAVENIEARNPELGLLTQKTKEYCDAFCTMTVEQKQVHEALRSLEIILLNDEHLFKSSIYAENRRRVISYARRLSNHP